MPRLESLALLALCTIVPAAWAQAAPPPADQPLPRGLTPAEQAYLREHPLVAKRGGAAPTGPLWCPPEYAPAEAILIAWEGTAAWNSILAQMAAKITTVGDADVYVGVDSSALQSNASSTLQAAGVDMARVRFFIKRLDTIWIRDYGPRFVYEGGVRVIIDHTYNRPRPYDDAFNDFFAAQMGFTSYDIPLVHGGGNFHLSGLGDSYATRLISNENPGLTDQEIIGLWQQYQGVNTTLETPFRVSVDATQHIDMWMIPTADRTVIISDWPLTPGSYEDVICDGVAATLAGQGYTVYRTPAASVNGTHYTYANAVICNDLVCVPTFTNSTMQAYNAQALATWQQACPGKTIVGIPCQSIITSAGALHCIAMHVPKASGGADPTIYLRSLNEPTTLAPGDQVDLQWISDDDVETYYVKLELSLDGGATWPIIIDSFQLDDGSFAWTVPDVNTSHGRIKAVVYDWDEGIGDDVNDADFVITGSGSCIADFNGDGLVNTQDVLSFLNAWSAHDQSADVNGDGSVNTLDVTAFLNAWTSGC
ncbi:MAG: agmatine deiminase family protein [Phycisphaerales bacterium]|nr:agmatine deiminase family protein [Phycisphaerales bacterium]